MFGNDRRLLVGIAIAAMSHFTTAHAATITYSDSDFANANWSAVEVLDTSPDNSYSFSAMRLAAGGNLGAYRQAINTLGSTTPSDIGQGNFRTGATFNPGVDGTFAALDMSFDGISLGATAGAMGYAVLLEQSGNYFSFGLGQVLNGAGWTGFGATGLTEGDFAALGAGTLDLSDSGSLVNIGVVVRNGTFGSPGVPSVNEGGFDNWSVSIHTAEIPAPTAALLFPFGLLAMGIARRRRIPRG